MISLPLWVKDKVEEVLREGKDELRIDGYHHEDEPAGPSAVRYVIQRLLSDDCRVPVTRLCLICCRLKSLPAEIGDLTALQRLECDRNQLESLPAELGKLTALQWLNCNSNQLKLLPAEIGNLTALQELRCSANQLGSLPAEIGKLTALLGLYCRQNKLQSLPAETGNLTALLKLACSDNQLKSLPAEIGNLAALQGLYCGGNQLESFPAEIGKLTALQWLFCGGNQLESLPAEIGNLTALQRLKCGGNQLKSLPEEIKKLTALQDLDCSLNKAERLVLPWEFLSLRTICFNLVLYGSKNVVVRRLREKEGGNAGDAGQASEHDGQRRQRNTEHGSSAPVPIDASLCGNEGYPTTAEALAIYVEKFASTKFERPRNIRLMIVGKENVGKTTLVEALCGRGLGERLQRRGRDAAGKRKVTFGLDIRVWRPSKGEDAIRFSIWDFAGQPEYHPTHQLFLSSDALYLLAFDASAAAAAPAGAEPAARNAVSGYTSSQHMHASPSGIDAIIGYLETWMVMLSARAPGARVIIVATHADKLKGVAGEAARQVLMAKVGDFVSRLRVGDSGKVARVVVAEPYVQFVDALHVDDGCRGLRTLCVSVASQIIGNRGEIPTALLKFGKDLRKRGNKAPVISRDIFKNNAHAALGIHLPRLAQTLRELGWVEYFGDNPALEEVVFTNPQWLAKMMACVATKLGVSLDGRGAVHVSELRKVWRDTDNASSEWLDQLVDVMLAFDLAHHLQGDSVSQDDRGGMLVIPSLLQAADDANLLAQRKSNKAQLELNLQQRDNDFDALRPVYTLSLCPAGIVSRLFVRMYTVPGISDVLGWQGGFLAMLPVDYAEPSGGASESQDVRGRQAALCVEMKADQSLHVAGSSLSAVAIFEEALLSLCGGFFGGRIAVLRNGGEIQFDKNGVDKDQSVDDVDDDSPLSAQHTRTDLSDGQAAVKSIDETWLRGRRAVIVTPPLISFEASRDLELGMRLGTGTYGEVYKCAGTGKNAALPLGATFALKRLVRASPAAGTNDVASNAASFGHEFRIMRKLAACEFTLGALGAQFGDAEGSLVTHILMPIFDTTLVDFVLKYAKGDQLAQLGWFDQDEVVGWLMQVAQGVKYVHDCGLAHLDIKPENVLVRLGAGFSIKLLALADFGTTMHAGSVANPAGELTSARGTPGFIAPELFTATRERPCGNLFAADIYSLGVVSSFVISAHLPKGNPQEQLGIPSSASAVRPPIDESPEEWDALRGVVAACLAANPPQRPSASHLVASRLAVGSSVRIDVAACDARREELAGVKTAAVAEVRKNQPADVQKQLLEVQKQLAEVQQQFAKAEQSVFVESQRAEAAEGRAEAEKRRADAEKHRADAAELLLADANKRASITSPKGSSADSSCWSLASDPHSLSNRAEGLASIFVGGNQRLTASQNENGGSPVLSSTSEGAGSSHVTVQSHRGRSHAVVETSPARESPCCEAAPQPEVEPLLLHFLSTFQLEHLLDECPLLRRCRLDLLLRRTQADMKRILGEDVFATPDGQKLVQRILSIRTPAVVGND